MSKLTRMFDAQDLQRLNAAVAEAEANTSAEIVPVVAAASGRYDRAEDLFGLLLGLLAAVAIWLVLPDTPTLGDGLAIGFESAASESSTGSSGGFASPGGGFGGSSGGSSGGGGTWTGYTASTKIAFMTVALLLGFIVGVALASRLWPLRRPLTPKAEMRSNVTRAASSAFFDQSLHHTSGGTGLLIYLSMYERRAAILADAAVLDALGQPALDTLCRDLTALLAGTDPTEALCQTLRRAGEQLAVLPNTAGTSETRPNKLVLLE